MSAMERPAASAASPVSTGTMAPPTIPMQSRAEARGASGPALAADRAKMVGNMIELQRPTARMATAATRPFDPAETRAELADAQQANDAMMGFQALRPAYRLDVSPILAMARMEAGGAVDPLAVYRDSGWRERKAQERRPVGLGAGIV